MVTVSDIIADIQRGIAAHNMIEDYFSYRLIYFVNSENGNKKYYIDTRYDGLRAALENIIRENLTTTNCLVIAAVTTRKSGETVSLLSKSYSFSLSGYFEVVCNRKREIISNNYGRRKVQWC